MESLFAPIMQWLETLAQTVSLEVFVVVGAFLEEIIAPIPSPFVMTTAAVLAQVQNLSVWNLGVLVVLAAIAKTASSVLVYVIADKAEDFVLTRFGKFFGISHQHIERLGFFLTKTWFDDVMLLVARALPVVPTFPVSFGAGVIKYSMRSFILMTFLGTILRNILYLWIAYFGWTYFQALKDDLWSHPLWLALGVILLLALVIWVLRAKDTLWEKILAWAPTKKR